MEFNYYMFRKPSSKGEPTTPIRYGIQLHRKVKIGDFITAVCDLHRVKPDRMTLYEIYQYEMLNPLDKVTYQKELSHHMNFNIKLVFYEIGCNPTPEYRDFRDKKVKGTSVKIELQQRVYSSKSKSYKLFYLPYLL